MMMDAPHIVVVDDNEEVLAAVSQVLRDAGYAVVGCRSTAAAAASVGERHPALVITELRVEQVFAGLSVLQQLQQNPETAHIPLILWSDDLAALDRVRELNADTITTVVKPRTPQQLLDLVAERCAPAAGA